MYLSPVIMLVSFNTFPTDWNYSVYVAPYLDMTYFENNDKYNEVLLYKSKQKESNIINPYKCLDILIDHTGLRYLRSYDSGKVLFLYFPTYLCYFQITEANLATVISRIFFQLDLAPEFFKKTFLDEVAKSIDYDSRISYLGTPENDSKKHLVSVGTKVWDLNQGTLLEDPSPELFVINYHDPSK